MASGPVRVTFGESSDPICFTIKGVQVERVELVNARGDAVEVKSGDRLPKGWGEPLWLRIHPRP